MSGHEVAAAQAIVVSALYKPTEEAVIESTPLCCAACTIAMQWPLKALRCAPGLAHGNWGLRCHEPISLPDPATCSLPGRQTAFRIWRQDALFVVVQSKCALEAKALAEAATPVLKTSRRVQDFIELLMDIPRCPRPHRHRLSQIGIRDINASVGVHEDRIQTSLLRGPATANIRDVFPMYGISNLILCPFSGDHGSRK